MKEIDPFRTEWRIAAPDIGLAGSVDFVGRLPDGTYAVMDWKRSKELPNKMDNRNNKYGKNAKYPLSHLDDCDGSKYCLQLNMYRCVPQMRTVSNDVQIRCPVIDNMIVLFNAFFYYVSHLSSYLDTYSKSTMA
jgi:hypothetical protein